MDRIILKPMRIRFHTLLVLALFAGIGVAADSDKTDEAAVGYRIVHPDGTVEFTDDATRGGEAIKLRGLQAVGKGAAVGEAQSAAPPKDETNTEGMPESVPAYTGVTIVSPLEGETIWFNENGLEVRFNVLPELNSEDEVVVELDGLPRARGKSQVLNVGLVYQGTHSLAVKVIDSQNTTLIGSSTVTFFMRQHTK